MVDRRWGYRAAIAFMVIMAGGAVLFGAFGLYTVLTGGTTDGATGVDVLGEYDCGSFDGDPEVRHNSSYGIEQTLVSASAIESVNATENGSGLRMEVVVDGGIVGASASRADGTPVPVEQSDDEQRVVVESPNTEPFRLWIDSVSEEATVVRTQLDICPP